MSGNNDHSRLDELYLCMGIPGLLDSHCIQTIITISLGRNVMVIFTAVSCRFNMFVFVCVAASPLP